MRFIVYNTESRNVYYKGATYFGFYPNNTDDLYKWKNEMYDNYDSAKRALRKLKKEDMVFRLVNNPTAKKENWVIAMVDFTFTFKII